MKKFLSVLLAGLLTLGMLCFTAAAETPLGVGSVTLKDVAESEDLATLTFRCTTSEDIRYMTVLLTTVEVTAGMSTLPFDDIIHIDQVERNAEGVYSFNINRARIPEGTKSLYLKVGGTSVNEPYDGVIALKSVLKGDCDANGTVESTDLIVLLQYLAGLGGVTIDLEAANVDTSDGTDAVDAKDLAKLRQFFAGLISSLD